jgi:predicted amidophosphoribosyltransferase
VRQCCGMRSLLNLLVPSCCDGCGARADPPWCAACAAVARSLRPDRPCGRCAGPDVAGHACWDRGTPIDATIAVTRWTGVVAAAITQAKLAGRAEVFAALGIELAAVVHRASVRVDVIVPVPTDPRRARQRGTDHTLILARAIAGCLGVPAVRAARVHGRLPDRGLQHSSNAAPAGRDRRVGRVVVPHPASVAGAHVLLVDDLVTTGVTLVQSADPVRRAGAARITAAVIARAGIHTLGRDRA